MFRPDHERVVAALVAILTAPCRPAREAARRQLDLALAEGEGEAEAGPCPAGEVAP